VCGVDRVKLWKTCGTLVQILCTDGHLKVFSSVSRHIAAGAQCACAFARRFACAAHTRA
jgi:hypothetical protein